MLTFLLFVLGLVYLIRKVTRRVASPGQPRGGGALVRFGAGLLKRDLSHSLQAWRGRDSAVRHCLTDLQ